MDNTSTPDVDSGAVGLSLPPVNRSRKTLLHEQVAAEIRRAIANGEARPGQKIPQVKDLAAELSVNSNTVLRALRILRDEGLVEMGRGRSIRVAGTQEQSAVVTRVRELVEFARRQGYEPDDLISILAAIAK
ncbi:MAG: GntR family transcriptional regulator [Acidimicrobiaceae bacterium]|nr:GntR family transcriptional regulator [Acidimicrobiaceae bacterium]